VVGRVVTVEMVFYSSGGWESYGTRRVACCGGADSMLWFQLGKRGDKMKDYRNMKQRH
jgi:hypothetical protein